MEYKSNKVVTLLFNPCLHLLCFLHFFNFIERREEKPEVVDH